MMWSGPVGSDRCRIVVFTVLHAVAANDAPSRPDGRSGTLIIRAIGFSEQELQLRRGGVSRAALGVPHERSPSVV